MFVHTQSNPVFAYSFCFLIEHILHRNAKSKTEICYRLKTIVSRGFSPYDGVQCQRNKHKWFFTFQVDCKHRLMKSQSRATDSAMRMWYIVFVAHCASPMNSHDATPLGCSCCFRYSLFTMLLIFQNSLVKCDTIKYFETRKNNYSRQFGILPE